MTEVERAPWSRRDAKPYEPGNTAALQSGVYSDRFVDPLARELVDAVRGSVSWWTPADEPSVMAWARVEAQCHLIAVHIANLSEAAEEVDLSERRMAAALSVQHRFETRAANLRRELGLTPLARVRYFATAAAGGASLAEAAALHRRMQEGS